MMTREHFSDWIWTWAYVKWDKGDGQLHKGLESPAVSGAQNYKELYMAAKREEQRLADLKKKQHYLNPHEMGRQKAKSLPNQQY